MDDRDRLIEELQHRVGQLSAALLHIDRDVARAARKHLRQNDGGLLEFSEFLDLLAAEIRQSMHAKYSNKLATKETLKQIVRERLDQEMFAMAPKLAGRLSDYLTFPVVILPKSHDIKDHMLVKTEPFFRAICVRGDGLRSVGPTPEEAWQEARKRIICKVFGAGPEETARQLSFRDWELTKKFEMAQPFRTETIEGFKVEVRLLSDKPSGNGA